jgi:hypothetical protein
MRSIFTEIVCVAQLKYRLTGLYRGSKKLWRSVSTLGEVKCMHRRASRNNRGSILDFKGGYAGNRFSLRLGVLRS